MRPLNRGNVPEVNGVPKTVVDYKDWRLDLINRIGKYCSYCNMPLYDSPQVEHVTPKNPKLGDEAGSMTDWDNMLLACGPCNRAKSNHPNSRASHYIPDYHNTHLVFNYIVINHNGSKDGIGCIPIPASGIGINTQKAQNTIDLCKLDIVNNNKRATDLRWKYRYEALVVAGETRQSFDKIFLHYPNEALSFISELAKAKGFFSIWFNVFYDVPEVKERLIEIFPGTHKESFDPQNTYDAIPRNYSDLVDPF
jgi:hypothetical protein